MHKVLCIILNFNSKKETEFLVKQLLENTAADILIIDNASRNDNFDHYEDRRINMIYNKKNSGYSGGNNIGLRYSLEKGYDYSWILNPDIEIENNSLDILLNTIQKDDQLAAVGPRICDKFARNEIYSDGGLLNSNNFQASHLNSRLKRDEINVQQGLLTPNYVNGSCVLLNNVILRKVGMFYEKFFMYYEETEWCWRAEAAGYKICINTDSVVYHERSSKGYYFYYYLTRNRSIFSRIVRKDNHWAKIAVKDIILEIKDRLLFKKKNPFLMARLRGAISGLTTNLTDYDESISAI